MVNQFPWLAWVTATIVAAVSGVFTLLAYSHANFTTKSESEIQSTSLEKRLEIMHEDIRIIQREVRSISHSSQ